MRKVISIYVIFAVLCSPALVLDSKKTGYVGGTIAGLKEGTEGKSSALDENNFVFEHKNGKLLIPYKDVEELEYGQKAGRRVAVAILVSPLAIFSKKRKHYLTISYKNEAGKGQAAVFELGKDVIRTMLSSLEARTGKQIQYQDEEAKKSAKGN
ncbi:MAG: hypothetical protein AB1757_21655 [Acidobacteriota bacterium]